MRPQIVDEGVFHHLAEGSGVDLISLFLPTARRGREVRVGAIRLKNLLAEADRRLERLGWPTERRADHLAAARALLDDVDFWEHQRAGLAVYIGSEGEVDAYSLGHQVDEACFVQSVFQVRPLIPELDRSVTPVLVLSRGRVEMYEARLGSLEPVEADLPTSFDDVNWFVDREKQRQQHPDGRGTKSGRHGHDAGADTMEDLRRFLRSVSAALSDLTDQPIVVFGDHDLIARFEDLHPTDLLNPDSCGLPGRGTTAELASAVEEVLAQARRRREDDLIEKALAALAVGEATAELDEALPAALAGRVGSLLLWRDAPPVWGRLLLDSTEVSVHQSPALGDVDLLDRLAVVAAQTGADLHAVDRTLDGDPLVAVFRY